MTKDTERQKGASELARRDCIPCKRGAKPLRGEALASLLWHLPDWECVKQHHITRTFEFDDFAQGLMFVNACGEIAEMQEHHPDLFLKWGLVRVDIYTHSIDGLCESDFVLAAKIDRIRR